MEPFKASGHYCLQTHGAITVASFYSAQWDPGRLFELLEFREAVEWLSDTEMYIHTQHVCVQI